MSEWLYARLLCPCGRIERSWAPGSFDEAVRLAEGSLENACGDECRPRLEVTRTVTLAPPIRVPSRELNQEQMRGVLYHDLCAYCGDPCEQLDHIEPRAHGGANGPENLTAACRSCNQRKRDKPLLSFLLEVAR